LKYATVLLFVCSLACAQDDKLLNIMQGELNREVTAFTKVSQPPYFIAYRVDDEQSAVVNASFGSLTQSDAGRQRTLYVTIRIGDYLVDNTHPAEREDMFMDSYLNMQATELPLDDHEEVVATKIWSATDAEYKAALKQFNNVKNALAVKKDEKSIPDFSKEQIEKYYEKPAPTLEDVFDKRLWEQKVRQYSKLFLGDASIVSADVSFQIIQDRRYYVSSEGASIVQNFGGAYIYVLASIRASDGEVVPLHRSYYAPTPAALPGDDAIVSDIKNMMVTLQKLKTAPMADPYTGPALLDGSVAGVFFHEIFGHRVEGHRLRSEHDGQTFKSKVNDKILPESMSVYCDPTLSEFAGIHLNGNYAYDDEGVKGKRVDVVEKGTLKNFLMSRTPLDNFAHSNGHARATSGMMPVSRQSNLFVDAAKTKSSAELKQLLVKECKKQKRPYGYYFKSVVGGFTNTDRYSPNAFNIFPTEVYKVYVDGRPDELVRGVDLIGTPLAMFAEISAVGNTPGVFVGFCGAESGYVPVSAVSPALFVRRIETQKKPKIKLDETILKAPVLPANGNDQKDDDVPVIQQAMRDELERNMKELRLDGFEKPFFINYVIRDQTVTQISASFGALNRSAETKSRQPLSTRLLVGDYEFNDESFDAEMSNQQQDNNINFPIDDDYLGIRRSLWIMTDNVYRGASRQFKRNNDILKEKNKPLSQVPHRSFAKATPSKVNIEAAALKFDKTQTEDYVRRVSAALGEFKELLYGNVEFVYERGYRYLVNSEGSMNRVPESFGVLTFRVGLKKDDGKVIDDSRSIKLPTDELPPVETMIAKAKDLAKQLITIKDAPKLDGEYIGPVLFEGEDAGYIIASQVTRNDVFDQSLLSYEKPNKAEEKIGKQMFPEGMTVKAAPKLNSFDNEILLGSYPVDEEGIVPADETILIENGVLKALRTSRTITRAGGTSNGLVSGPGVLQFSFKNSVPLNTLKVRLIEAAKKEGLDYALLVKNIRSSELRGGNVGVYKVYVDDGREELVRDAAMMDISQRDFRKILATSAEMMVSNMPMGNYLSVIGPQAILLGEVEFNGASSDDPLEKPETYVPSPRKK
jgi:TldD protein